MKQYLVLILMSLLLSSRLLAQSYATPSDPVNISIQNGGAFSYYLGLPSVSGKPTTPPSNSLRSAVYYDVQGRIGYIWNPYSQQYDSIYHIMPTNLVFNKGLVLNGITVTNDLVTGRLGGDSIRGGTAAGDSLWIASTTSRAGGRIYFGVNKNSVFDGQANRIGLGTSNPLAAFHVSGKAILDASGLLTDASGIPTAQTITAVLNSSTDQFGISSVSSGGIGTSKVYISPTGVLGFNKGSTSNTSTIEVLGGNQVSIFTGKGTGITGQFRIFTGSLFTQPSLFIDSVGHVHLGGSIGDPKTGRAQLDLRSRPTYDSAFILLRDSINPAKTIFKIDNYGRLRIGTTYGGTTGANDSLLVKKSDSTVVAVPRITPYQYGGIGLTTLGTPGQSLRVNTTGNGYEFYTPSSGGGGTPSNITVNGIAPDSTGNISVPTCNGNIPSGTPTVSFTGSGVSSTTITGDNGKFELAITTTGAVSGTICNITFGGTWLQTPVVVNSLGNAGAIDVAKIAARATSTTNITVSGSISAAGTYYVEFICR